MSDYSNDEIKALIERVAYLETRTTEYEKLLHTGKILGRLAFIVAGFIGFFMSFGFSLAGYLGWGKG